LQTFIAQEQPSIRRLWVVNNQGWTIAYKSEVKKHRLIVKLVGIPKVEDIKGGENVLTVYFLSTELPIWILFLALGVSSDKEVIDMIDYDSEDASILNILFASIHDANENLSKKVMPMIGVGASGIGKL
jgi:DNA-directed RNA polymerase-4/5 subunit 2